MHKTLGPGLLESVYHRCLLHELEKSGLNVQSEKAIPLVYDGIEIEYGFRADLIVNEMLIIEIKAVEVLNDQHFAQIMTYLRLSGIHRGLLLNFHESKLKNGIRRVVL